MNLKSLLNKLVPVKLVFENKLPPGISPDMFMSVEEFLDDANTENSLPGDEKVDRSPAPPPVATEGKKKWPNLKALFLSEAGRMLPMVPNKPVDVGEPSGDNIKGRVLPDAEMNDYIADIDKNRSKYVDPKTGNTVDKKFPGAKYVSPSALSYRDKPLLHSGNIVDQNGKVLDAEALKAKIKQRPKEIIRQNAKLAKSSGGAIAIYNLSLPAMMGLVVDEATNEFKIINTCPSAGACKVYCYATKGGYIQYKDVSLAQSQTLNFLVNNWDGFKFRVIGELQEILKKFRKTDTDVYLRWHDAGDFFSDKYLALAYEIARAVPEVTFYAYTKRVGMATGSNVPDNFIFNFSKGAIGAEERLIDKNEKDADAAGRPEDKLKLSRTVQPSLFRQFVKKAKFVKGKKRDGTEELGTKTVAKSPEDLQKLKQSIADHYKIDINKLLSYDEMMNTPVGKKNEYNVIVMPGDGDVSATRRDVLGTYLLLH